MTGDSDYLLRVVVSDTVALQHFIVGQLSKARGVANIRSSFALKQVKYKTALPIHEPDRSKIDLPRNHYGGARPGDEALALEVRPERRRDRMPAMVDVLSDLIGADRAGDDRGDDRMGEGELEGRRASGTPGPCKRPRSCDPIHLFRCGVMVVVLSARCMGPVAVIPELKTPPTTAPTPRR